MSLEYRRRIGTRWRSELNSNSRWTFETHQEDLQERQIVPKRSISACTKMWSSLVSLPASRKKIDGPIERFEADLRRIIDGRRSVRGHSVREYFLVIIREIVCKKNSAGAGNRSSDKGRYNRCNASVPTGGTMRFDGTGRTWSAVVHTLGRRVVGTSLVRSTRHLAGFTQPR